MFSPPPAASTLKGLLILVGAGVLAGFPAVILFQRADPTTTLNWPSIIGTLIVGALLATLAKAVPARFAERSAAALGRVPDGLVAIIAVGVILRLAVLFGLEPQPASDGKSYLQLASQLAENGTYGSAGDLAFWPPGLPLLLTPLYMLGLGQSTVLAVYGVGTFAATVLGLRAIMRRLGFESGAGLAMWCLALWPTHVLASALPEKELAVMGLLVWTVERALRAMEGRMSAALTAGVLSGMAVLIQPSLQMLPLAMLLAAAVWGGRARRRAMLTVVLATLAMLAVIAPWTARNLAVFGTPVLVSSNGGSVLYRANNELATGAYTPRGAVSLEHLDEVSRDREYKRLASQWITANPLTFVQLGLGKSLLFLGDASYGVYVVFTRGGVELDRVAYLTMRLLCNAAWLVLWFLTMVWAFRSAGDLGRGRALQLGVVALPLLYLLAIHAVFESGTKYHIPALGSVFVLFAAMAHAAPGSTAGR